MLDDADGRPGGKREGREGLEGPVLVWGERRPSLLLQLLNERMMRSLENLFRLLALLYPSADMRDTFRGLLSHDSGMRGNALEYLDNTLDGDIHRFVFGVVDDTPVSERLRSAERLLGLPSLSAEPCHLGGVESTDTVLSPCIVLVI